jgi:hypothetical protein
MKMRLSRFIGFALVLVFANVAFAQVTYLENISSRQLDEFTANTPAEIGMWEYVYDLQGNGGSRLDSVTLTGFDASLIVNTNDSGALQQKWDWAAATNTGWWGGSNGSISYDLATWTVADPVYEIDNTWHDPTDYWGFYHSWFGPAPGFLGTGSISATDLFFQARVNSGDTLDGLLLTFRIVHPDSPGDVDWSIRSFATGNSGTVIGPAAAAVRDGDFTDDLGGLPDDMINAYDIDALADAILNGGDVATFDLVIDGVLDSLDMDMLIEMLVDTTIVDAGEEYGFITGSFYGDFNLDGTVNLLDLNKLTANYNGLGGWTLGDANGDGAIALLDLNKLTANYNSTVVVPEPATIFVMACGAAAMIRRRRRA